MENMTAILDSLSKTLRLTREGRKIKSIVPVTVPMQNEGYIGIYARITYMDGHTKADMRGRSHLKAEIRKSTEGSRQR